jgi:hypothetical protein
MIGDEDRTGHAWEFTIVNRTALNIFVWEKIGILLYT